jgi:hypothetical protein
MPIVTINAISADVSARIDTTLERVVTGLAAALGTDTSNVWAQFAPLTAVQEGSHRGENYHVVVTVLANPRPDDVVAQGLHAVAAAVISGLGISQDRVWIHWVDLPARRVFASGGVV